MAGGSLSASVYPRNFAGFYFQEAAKVAASESGSLSAPELLDMSKFALKAYNRFTRGVEVGALVVAHFLLGQPSAYIPKGDKSVMINFYYAKTKVRRVLNSLLNETSDEDVAESANQYVNFDGRTSRTSIASKISSHRYSWTMRHASRD